RTRSVEALRRRAVSDVDGIRLAVGRAVDEHRLTSRRDHRVDLELDVRAGGEPGEHGRQSGETDYAVRASALIGSSARCGRRAADRKFHAITPRTRTAA